MKRLVESGAFTDVVYDDSEVLRVNRHIGAIPQGLAEPLRDGIKMTS